MCLGLKHVSPLLTPGRLLRRMFRSAVCLSVYVCNVPMLYNYGKPPMALNPSTYINFSALDGTYKLYCNHCNGFDGEPALTFGKENFKRRPEELHDERGVVMIHAVVVYTCYAFCNDTTTRLETY